jgi:hypothetical protein
MASVSTNKTTGERTLQFTLAGKRKSIWLGTMSKRDVTKWKESVEELVAAKMQNNRAPYDETSRWVAGLDIRLHSKLVKAGLAEPRESEKKAERTDLAAFITSYIAGRTDVKPATEIVYGHTKRCLVEFFGSTKPLASITPGDADDWRRWLSRPTAEGGQGLSESTARRRCGIAKQYFRAAVRRRLIAENPFADMKGDWRPGEPRTRLLHFTRRRGQGYYGLPGRSMEASVRPEPIRRPAMPVRASCLAMGRR